MSKSNQYKYNEQEQLITVFLIVLSIMISFFFIEINEKNLLMFLRILIIIIFIAFQLKLDVMTVHLVLIFIVLWFFCDQECYYEAYWREVLFYCDNLPLHTMESIESGIRHRVELANCETLNHLFPDNKRIQSRMDFDSQLNFAKLCLSDTAWLDTYLNINVPIKYQLDVKNILTRNCYCFHIARELNRFINIYRPQL
jgi:hypothetical protein